MSLTPQPSVELLADREPLISVVAAMRHDEWGGAPGGDGSGLDGWIEVTRREAGRHELPITWVAVDGDGDAVGAAALLAGSDLEGRPELAPSLGGVIIDPRRRRMGVGALLLSAIDEWARGRGISRLWVVTGEDAVDFYRRCGWEVVEETRTTWPNVEGQEAVWVLVRRP